ncbi:hypothetical protein [Clostridium perfringens]|uniref:hypothetical protein n=1 Tax=Clostridium perfringens TaxID=1502 RepID=UPI001F18AC3D|nr:hypothetical protein [Clostridium perfringens]
MSALLACRLSILALIALRFTTSITFALKSSICFTCIESIILPSTVPLSVVILFTVSVVS